jgi:hypothetical protein
MTGVAGCSFFLGCITLTRMGSGELGFKKQGMVDV